MPEAGLQLHSNCTAPDALPAAFAPARPIQATVHIMNAIRTGFVLRILPNQPAKEAKALVNDSRAEHFEPSHPTTETDSMWAAWLAKAPVIYDQIYYKSNPLVASVNLAGHRMIERPFDNKIHFESVLEVGAGTGAHLDHVRHSFNRYIVTDLSAEYLALAKLRHGGKGERTLSTRSPTLPGFPIEVGPSTD